jgi:hypothetical protein
VWVLKQRVAIILGTTITRPFIGPAVRRQLRHAEPDRALSDAAQSELTSREPSVCRGFIETLPLKASCAVTCTDLLRSLPRSGIASPVYISDRPRGYRFEGGEVSALSRAPGSHLRRGPSALRMRGSFPRAFEHFFK